MDTKDLKNLMEAYTGLYASEQLEEGMTMKDFKQQRSRQKQKEKRAAEKLSPTRRAGIHTPEKAPEREARRSAAGGETGYGGALRAKKVRKAKALGELGEQVDIFDIVLEFLCVEGIAETLEDAEKIMATELDSEDIDAIIEASYSAKAARVGKDIGKPGKQFEKIAKEAGERYGSKERGEKVAGAVLAKLRAKRG